MPNRAVPALQERKQHGSVLFPYNIYPCTIPRDFPSVPLHWQESMEILYIKKGCGRVRAGFSVQNADAGDIFLLPPGTLHAIYGIRGAAMEYENIIFDVMFLGAGAADVCAQRYLIPLAAGRLALPEVLHPGQPAYPAAAGCLQQAEVLCGQRGPGYELGVKAAMLAFLYQMIAAGPDKPPPAETADTGRLKAVLRRVETDYASRLPVSQVAADCGCSASNFMRWFKKRTGLSFTAFLNERRLTAAAEALRQTDDTVLAVAESAGFENLSNFNRQFKARYGVTPRQYRAG